jgi:hypothetical protein
MNHLLYLKKIVSKSRLEFEEKEIHGKVEVSFILKHKRKPGVRGQKLAL